MKKLIATGIGILVGVSFFTAIGCASAVTDSPPPSEGNPPAAAAPTPTQTPEPDEASDGSEKDVTIIDDMDPDKCDLVHNINACFSDGKAPENADLGPFMDVFLKARQDLAERFGFALTSIKIKEIEKVEWPDTSLGNPQPGHMYAQVITPGYRLVLEVDGKSYEYHTSMERVVLVGEATRVDQVVDSGKAPVTIIDGMEPGECSFVHNIEACFAGAMPSYIALDQYADLFMLARKDLVSRFAFEPSAVRIRDVQRVDWPDASLGHSEPGMGYIQVITPGFKLVLEAEGKTFTYHTSMDRVVFVGSDESAKPSGEHKPVSPEDRAALVRLALQWALAGGNIPDYGLLTRQGTIVVSLANIEAGMVPELPGVEVTLLTPEEVQQKANQEGDFLYIKISGLDVSDSQARVVVDNQWAIAEGSDRAYLSGGGCQIRFEKMDNEWQLKDEMSCWIA